MESLKKFGVEKGLGWLFMLLSAGWCLKALIHLGVFLKIGEPGGLIRGWVGYLNQPLLPDSINFEGGNLRVYGMHEERFVMVDFNQLSEMLHGRPLAYLVMELLAELAVALVLIQMMLLFRSAGRGDIFRSDAPKRLRYIAGAVLFYSLLTFLKAQVLATIVLVSGSFDKPVISSVHVERILFGALIALIIFALLRIFKLGTQLQQEQDLTI